MSDNRSYYRIVSKFGPQDLFLILKKTCEKPAHKKHGARFDFDWMKRKIELAAANENAAEALLADVIERTEKTSAKGLLLPGRSTVSDKECSIPIGVLLQSPDVYTQMLVGTLTEMGLPGVRSEFDGDGFSAPAVGAASRILDFRGLIQDFPFPEYLAVEEVSAEG